MLLEILVMNLLCCVDSCFPTKWQMFLDTHIQIQTIHRKIKQWNSRCKQYIACQGKGGGEEYAMPLACVILTRAEATGESCTLQQTGELVLSGKGAVTYTLPLLTQKSLMHTVIKQKILRKKRKMCCFFQNYGGKVLLVVIVWFYRCEPGLESQIQGYVTMK